MTYPPLLESGLSLWPAPRALIQSIAQRGVRDTPILSDLAAPRNGVAKLILVSMKSLAQFCRHLG
jgi:hypothetical protein